MLVMKNNFVPPLPNGKGIYGNKDRSLPRFIYRRLFHALSSAKSRDERMHILRSSSKELIDCRGADAIKMKWRLPKYIMNILDKDELTLLSQALKSRKRIKGAHSALIFPHCADEFDISPNFYASTFGEIDLPPFSRDTTITTLGSCFARNISFHLKELRYNCENLSITEDMNSPMSNLELVRLCLEQDKYCENYLQFWNEKFFALSDSLTRDQIDKSISKDIESLQYARSRLVNSHYIILTFGNVLNFAPIDGVSQSAGIPPRFLRLFQSEAINSRISFNGAMKSLGYELKAFTHEDTLNYCKDLISSLSMLNPSAKIVLTLSPVPVDSVLGLKGIFKSSVTLDCYSKSTLRSCIQHLIDSDNKIRYFPAFEIVRWLAPVSGCKVFGEEDAASRHVSEKVLLSIYDYFVSLVSI